MKNNLKKIVQNVLRRAGMYHRLKSSCFYDLYWSVADPRLLKQRKVELAFYRNGLGGLRAGDLIVDVGANQGFKTEIFLRLGARVVAVDPDATNQAILTEKFKRWRLRKPPVTIVGKALGEEVGTETMWVNEPGSAKNTLNRKWVETLSEDATRFGERLKFVEKRQVEVTTLEELFRAYGRPFYVKIDVEGYEAVVLRGLKSAVPWLSFEVNLPEFLPEARQCITMLNTIDSAARWNFFSDCAGGMTCEQWLSTDEMLKALEECRRPTIEIFWHSSSALAHLRGRAAK